MLNARLRWQRYMFAMLVYFLVVVFGAGLWHRLDGSPQSGGTWTTLCVLVSYVLCLANDRFGLSWPKRAMIVTIAVLITRFVLIELIMRSSTNRDTGWGSGRFLYPLILASPTVPIVAFAANLARWFYRTEGE